MFINFPIFLLLLMSSLTSLWSKKILGMSSVFLNLLRLILQPNIQSFLGNFHVHFRRMCFLLLDRMFYMCLLGSFVHSVVQVCCLNCWGWGIKVFNYYYNTFTSFFSFVSFFLKIYFYSFGCGGSSLLNVGFLWLPHSSGFLLFIFRCSNFGCINTLNCYKFLMEWPHYYVMTFVSF